VRRIDSGSAQPGPVQRLLGPLSDYRTDLIAGESVFNAGDRHAEAATLNAGLPNPGRDGRAPAATMTINPDPSETALALKPGPGFRLGHFGED
jgi:hypothetical protein